MKDLGFYFNGESAHLDCEAFLYILYMHVDCIILLNLYFEKLRLGKSYVLRLMQFLSDLKVQSTFS